MALRKCACIDTLYTELDWLDRFQAAKNDGFEAVEFWDWRIRDLDATREAAEKAGIAISGFNGDADYSLVDPTHQQKYLDDLKQSIAAAKKVGAASVTIHSNALGDGGIVVNHYDNLSHTVKLCSMYDTLLACAELAEKEEINLNLEALRSYGKLRSATYTMLRGSGYMLEEMQKRIAEPSAEVAARLESLRKMIDEDPDGDGIHDVE